MPTRRCDVLIDTHCHIHSDADAGTVRATIDRAVAAGVTRLIVVGTRPDDWEIAVRAAETHPEVFALVGWHPNYSADYDRRTLRRLATLLEHPRVLGLGEIGLDFHWTFASLDQQEAALLDQLDLATEMNLPVVFHAREAVTALLNHLESRPRLPYLLHCFSGTLAEAHRARGLGCIFGVDGPVTYPKSVALRAMIADVGLGHWVLETDAPYLSPVPFRGKPNEPSYVPFIAEGVAAAGNWTVEEVKKRTTETAVRFFGTRLVA